VLPVTNRRAGGATLTARAFAKINLSLRILGRRPDGFHEVRTVLQTLALHDTLTLAESRGPFTIVCSDPACPTDHRNLVWRAAEHVWRAAGRGGPPRGVEVRIEKRIPLQSGLGGGSSDAAAAIGALSRLWRTELAPDKRYEIAAALGADVPFFLVGGTALGVGRGSMIFPTVDLARRPVVIVLPGFGVSTSDAYGWWDTQQSEGQESEASQKSEVGQESGVSQKSGVRSQKSERSRKSGRKQQSRDGLFEPGFLPPGELTNDLQAPVMAHHPQIARIIRALVRRGAAYAAMSGSGSAVFGLFTTAAGAESAAAALRPAARRVIVTRTIDRRALSRRFGRAIERVADA
jgi:4-diphosphocytidyl-2-C-methyl-D-erythritol kinase